jgi:AcrR family transcriptional regulator
VSQETRRRIVEAATCVLARRGYVDTTIKDIAAEAGVAAGLVHYYFKTKEELVVAALNETCEELSFPEQGDDPEAMARGSLERLKQATAGRTAALRMYIEMIGLSMHNEALRQALLRFVAADRGRVEEVARAVLAGREGRSPDEAPAIAGAVWGAILGIQAQRLMDPDFDAAAAIDSLTEMALEGRR